MLSQVRRVHRDEAIIIWIEANNEAKKLGNLMTAGNICLGALNARVEFISREGIEQGLSRAFPGKQGKLITLNMEAYDLGARLANGAV